MLNDNLNDSYLLILELFSYLINSQAPIAKLEDNQNK